LITHQDHKTGVQPEAQRTRKAVHPSHPSAPHSAAAGKEAL
jgi:hypothetical protein